MDEEMLAKKLIRKFNQQCKAFIKKRDKMNAELKDELCLLRTEYGSETVYSRLWGGRFTPYGYITFSELRNRVADFIPTFGKTKFTIRDIQSALAKAKIRYNPVHLPVVLGTQIRGISVVDKQKRGGMALNVYATSGKVVPVAKKL